MLNINNVTKNFSGLIAINDLELNVREGTIHGLIGPNGSGKTTLFNMISGVLRTSRGEIFFKGKKLNEMKPNQITRLGIARTFQNIRPFGEMTLLENVMVGRHCRSKSGFIRMIFQSPLQRKEEREIQERAHEYLHFVGLSEKCHIRATQLSYGEQRRLEVARALSTEPKILLLDEPAAGLNQQETENLESLILNIQKSGKTIFLIEHDMSLVMKISDLVTVINFGKKIAEGDADSVQNNPSVIEAYLGGGSFVRDTIKGA